MVIKESVREDFVIEPVFCEKSPNLLACRETCNVQGAVFEGVGLTRQTKEPRPSRPAV
ncbi:hypothetical protein GCM10027217_31830 [Pseudomaricurvus hydrocarbonicus]